MSLNEAAVGSRERSLACVECGRRSAGRARGWRAYLVESDDNPLLDEVVCYCASCAMREFGDS